MIGPESRYQEGERLFVLSHTYGSQRSVDMDEDTGAPRLTSREAVYVLNTLPLPDPPPHEYYVKVTDDYQRLAAEHLGDSQRWWQLADANPQVRYPLDLTMGDVIYLPE